jgi:class 3 adenylate cyclase/tetratricopeptide (TPR) repeat protein
VKALLEGRGLDGRTALMQTSGMLACARCGQSSPEGARFCQACGARLSEAPPQLRKTITSLFCDLAGSTALAESLADPEAIHDVLTRYFVAMTTVIERHGGTVEKFAGDAILGTFGVPLSHEDDALRAVRAAVEMRETLSSLNDELEGRWGVALQLKIGINSGEILTGDSISGQAMALGDPVNVAARLEQTAEPGDIILGETTLRLVEAAVQVDAPQPLPLKGKAEHVATYRLVGLAPETALVARRFTRPMVGRTRELQALRDAYQRVVAEGRGEVLVVIGSAGVGKSRLVAAFEGEVEGEAAIYLARFPSYGERTAFWPLAEIVRRRAGVGAFDTPAAGEVKLRRAVDAVVEDRGERLWLADWLAALTGLAPAPEEGDSFAAWRRFLERVAAARPLVLVFEDLHWAEDAFLDFLDALRGCAARILVLCTARPDLDERRLTRAEGQLLRLAPLASAEITTVVEEAAGQSLPSEIREDVVARAGGSPLFAEALGTMIADRGLEEIGTAGVPDTVEALVAARLDALRHPLRSLVLDAAVIGSSIRAEALSSMGELDPGTVKDGMKDLVGREFLRLAGREEYEFWHGLVREVAYRQIPRVARSAKHRTFAEWLEGHGGEEAADLLAHHFGRAFDLAVEARESHEIRRSLAAGSFRYGVLAAERALRGADPEAAAALLGHAAEALREIPAPDLEGVGEAGGVLVALGRWSDAVDLLAPFAGAARPPILRALGVAMCKVHRDDPRGADYRSGQAYLERAAAQGDTDAIASLAGTWKGIDDTKVRDLYRRASELDPADPYPLGNLLEYEVQAAGDLSPVEEMREQIAAAIERCHEQAAAGQNLPWAYYDLGKLRLFLGLEYESLEAYAKAVDLSPAAFMVETSLASLQRLSAVADRVQGLAWSRDLLALAIRAKFGEEDAPDGSIAPPVVVLAGGASSEEEEKIGAIRTVLVEAFRDFRGTVISGGTRGGVSGLAGDLSERYPNTVRTVGYLPRIVPAAAEPDGRYKELRRTEAWSFSPLEPLTYWGDLLDTGIRPTNVKLIGMGGGRVAAAEYTIGLSLGATVGLIRGSGRAADEILSDGHWSSAKRMIPLTPDIETLHSFLPER